MPQAAWPLSQEPQTRTEGAGAWSPTEPMSVDRELPAHTCVPTQLWWRRALGALEPRQEEEEKGNPWNPRVGLSHQSSWVGLQSQNYKVASRKTKKHPCLDTETALQKKKNKGRGGSFTSKSVDVTVQAPSSPPASPSPLPSKAPSHRISTGQPSTAPLLKAGLCGVQGEDSPYSDLQGWQRPRALSSACRFPQPGNEVPPTRLSPSHAA